MVGVICPQCKKIPNGAASRLVKDSCGHEKCRKCLLLDEEKCQQCKTEIQECKTSEQQSVIKFETHSGVISSNGIAKESEYLPLIPNGVKERKCDEPKLAEKSSKSKISKENKRMYNNRVVPVPDYITTLTNPVQYKCNICCKQFTTKSHIKYHVYCAGQKKPFECNTCKKTFITKSHLDVHIMKHNGNKPHKCNICQKSFSEKSKLKRHSILHTSSKPYVCTECGKAFRSNESLKIHTLIHRGEKPHTCRLCQASFNNSSNLNKHLISHSKEKPHMCDQCGKTFKLKWALTVHRRSHSKSRPFDCISCSKSFVNHKDLQRHQLIHLDTKAYKCTICKTGFRRKDNLYRHVKNAHPGKKMEPISPAVKQLIATTVKELLAKPTSRPVDNPNAINVIMASPACKSKIETIVNKTNNRTGTVINGPLKLAFKTSEFKSNYNINRDYDYDTGLNVTKPYDLAESVNICQKILSPNSPPARNLIRAGSEAMSTEICQKILSPFPTRPINYETSFEHKKHAIIKNIKFKLPPNYLKCSDNQQDGSVLTSDVESPNKDSYTSMCGVPNSATSVIVNIGPNQNNSMHWRRRTSQNFSSRNFEN